MNAPERIDLPDLQSSPDTRALAIDAVGIKGLRHPLSIRSGGHAQAVVATIDMTVALPASVKGTHMSRFIELLERQRAPLDAAGLRALAQAMLARLDARRGTIVLRFPWFIRKRAPVSGVTSLLDHDVEWRVHADGASPPRVEIAVSVPVTSLCPCSKEISAYGAHNQRSLVTIDVEVVADLAIDELAAIASRAASCEIYGLLKRVDEKHVTERAYDNPRFVEDLVREIGVALRGDERVRRWQVEAENFESIHNHSAFARLASAGGAGATVCGG
jgi:GTP cyclohydrolase FolE2